MKIPLIDQEELMFNRGKYEYMTIPEVAETDPNYLVFLVESSKTDSASISIIEDFMEQNPSFFNEENSKKGVKYQEWRKGTLSGK